MAPFVVRQLSPLPAEATWARVVDWRSHARYVPLTTIEVREAAGGGVGSVFTARTGVGRVAFDDPMEIVAWDPPRFCRIEKRGTAVRGWAELSVEPNGSGSCVTWREDAVPTRLPRIARRASDAAGRALFRRVLRGLLRDS